MSVSVCPLNHSKTYEWILMNFLEGAWFMDQVIRFWWDHDSEAGFVNDVDPGIFKVFFIYRCKS